MSLSQEVPWDARAESPKPASAANGPTRRAVSEQVRAYDFVHGFAEILSLGSGLAFSIKTPFFSEISDVQWIYQIPNLTLGNSSFTSLAIGTGVKAAIALFNQS